MGRLYRVLVVMLLVALPHAVAAQTPASPPPPLTQQQFDTLVGEITKAVAEKLATEAPAAKPAGPAPAAAPPAKTAPKPADAPPMATMGNDQPTDKMFVDFIARTRSILAAYPDLLDHLGRIPGYFVADMNNGRPVLVFLVMLVLAAGCALGAEAAMRAATTPLRRRLAAGIAGPAGLGRLAAIAGLDGLGLGAVWLVSYGFVAVWFRDVVPQDRFAYLVLTTIFAWRLAMLVFHVALRPSLPPARLAELDDADTAAIYLWIGGVIALVLILHDVVRILIAAKAPDEAVALAELIDAVLVPAAFIRAAVALREPVARWFRGLSRNGQPGPVQAVLARGWLVIAIPVFVALGLARAYGAITDQMAIREAVALSMDILIGLLLLETLLDKAGRLMGRDADQAVGHIRHRIIEAVVRCLRVAILIGAVVLLARAWLVDASGMMDMEGYGALARSARAAGLTLFGAYCAWQVVKFFTDRHSAIARPLMPGQSGDDPTASAGSRLATLMPVLRVAFLVLICILAVLTSLSQLGVNITPLIAGASIAGLAISFGSQTLVRDIVSGVFYLVDDAFRVGEYIDCGKAKGTVEGFTLRSLRLRHQNGPVHTIPFGQLGQITNYSRDWSTMKFNLRFVRNTDVEKLRKVVKKIGLEMLQDPEMKDEFLLPLKLQGVTDITDNALVCRFKFTVKPNKPTVIQREAIKRMIRALPEAGIEFANATTVAVQTLGGPVEQAAAAAAGNAMVRAAAEREAAAAAG
ncbi:mechanosensitive ion channel family protein [Labrys wisconsinensis]|uniref:Small-conductance mechanosensitive channel n=1 Tax=Labrys wisconsinensis TaxID=425677 RepID=A0ABU0J1D0_9HYPH|nr:mechanosensitive ion channel family protein [Labrys wisconsinensis]MDQ0467042.1 small-conductance mechanosensitive channel [Labrys wisconsinensis]